MSNISFKYSGQSSWQIKNADIKIESNQFVAIIGKSGIGKSTITSLIFRLFDPQ